MDSKWNQETAFLIDLKLKKLQRSSMTRISRNELLKTLDGTKWAAGRPQHLSVIAEDISALTIEDIVKYLTKESWVSKYSLADLTGSIEGEGNEKE